MKLEEALRTRRSVRAYDARPVPTEEIERILELAITAPSASNKQPWRFLVVRDRDRIGAMASAVREQVAQIARSVPASSTASFEAYGSYFTRFEDAPVVIVPIHRGHTVLSQLVDDTLDAEALARIVAMERDSGLVGTSLAIMNLLLAAHEAGLGASAMTGPLVAVDALMQILGVPARWGIAALVPLGYPAESPKPPGRKPLSAAVRWL